MMQHQYREAPDLGHPLRDVVYVCSRCGDRVVRPRSPIHTTQEARDQEGQRLSDGMHYTRNCHQAHATP